ncbi:MAG: hypothetical protein IJ864_02150 [Alphaproteobacteria bacterium]|nr:hypothetical protein [Alphaproteobacteria bacterium]
MISTNLLLLIIIPLLGSIFTITAKSGYIDASKNAYNVAAWTLMANIGVIFSLYLQLDPDKNGIQLVEKYQWLHLPQIDIFLGVDMFSMLLLTTLGLSFLMICLSQEEKDQKAKAIATSILLFVSMLNGYILAADIMSFYIFFAAINIPLIMLISFSEKTHKKNILIRFSLYNLIGIMLLFLAVMTIYDYKGGNIPLNTAGNLNLSGKKEYFVWISLCLAFMSRLPIWPFHYWIASMNASLHNAMVFVISNLMPLVGLYGFMRFWPNSVPKTIAVYAPYFEIICLITMLLIAVISLSSKESRYKLFAYTTVYYILYLIGVFLPTGSLKMNIGVSLFSYIMIFTVISIILGHIEQEKKRLNLHTLTSMLCYMPRATICLSLYILAGIGLPITPLFWNNFIIISEIFNNNLLLGILVVMSVFLVGLSLLEELYRLKDRAQISSELKLLQDLSRKNFIIYIAGIVCLLIILLKSLWMEV